ncbi:MAG: RagB/SusD family nutrient uptake outer membrane protein [Gemmatimonadaceae bacterium]|nr:RagB/SusD family nutrient uptake outer membrane protein [Gemmatimonadaceae bacterium]
MHTHLSFHKEKSIMRDVIRACGFALLAFGAASCDTKVTNPGPVKDVFLEDRNAASAMVNGSGRALSGGINFVSYTGAAITREIHPAGSTGSFGITNRWQIGELNADDGDLDVHWEQASRARWIAEETVRRLIAAEPPPAGSLQTLAQYNTLLMQAYVYVGYANRVLGENMCEAVIDGGAIQPNAVYFTRAEAAFTAALAVTGGTAATVAILTPAARAGRAAARVFLGDWTNAVTDATAIPIAFVYSLPYFNLGEDAQRNRIAYASANTPYRAHTQWSTWYRDYVTATPDPRVPINLTSTAKGDAAIDCCGLVAFLPQLKHSGSASPIRLASGREMLLIRAEDRLRQTTPDIVGAIALINQVRTNAGTATVAATTATEAWRLLKRERGIELWLEARRLGDRRRWGTTTPGAYDPLELPGPTSHLTRQDLCFPISRSERETNPNIDG